MNFTDKQRAKIKRLAFQRKNSEQIAKIVGIDKGSVAAYLGKITTEKELRKIREKLLIIECTSESVEDKSESLLLNELIRILEPVTEPRIVQARGRGPFLNKMENAEELFIHISAHGKFRNGKRVCGTYIYFPSGKRVSANDLKKLWKGKRVSKKPKLIILSACQTGQQDMAKALYEAGCRYFVAPEEDVYWFDAAVFLTIFYTLLLVENHTPWVSFKKADYGLKKIFPSLSGKWRFYDKGEKITYV